MHVVDMHGHTAGWPYAPKGKVVQVDPIKPTLEPPGTKRVETKTDILVSNFAIKFNLRRYTKVGDGTAGVYHIFANATVADGLRSVGRCRLTLSNPR
jgi:hypothetical protein